MNEVIEPATVTTRQIHWENVWQSERPTFGRYYQRWLQRVYAFIIPKGSRVLDIGCGNGDLLASLEPSVGVGIDFSETALAKASEKHTELNFQCLTAESVSELAEKYDYILLSDLVNDLWDVQAVLQQIAPLCHPGTRIIFNFYSQIWRFPFRVAQKFNLATPTLTQNWLTVKDLVSLFTLESFELLDHWNEMIVPLPLPGANWFNRYLAKIPPFRWLALANLAIARSVMIPATNNPSCSIVIAARNEAGHIEELFNRIPKFCADMELIFVEGHSSDNTFEAIEQSMSNHPEVSCKLLRQAGSGKGDAVRAGFNIASGDILMILDADMTVRPEELPRFYEAIASGKGEFINGVRLLYPMEEEAMRFLNLMGNKLFAEAFSWLLGQPIRDTLCGTKVMWHADYLRLTANRHYFGDFDPFGDFDLLFGASKLKLKILELPIRYHSRRYGETNISRWRHGVLLLRMVIFATRRIKFF